jgi:peptide/nickel transport system substrate-binding protein
MLNRRALLLTGGLSLAAPALAQPARSRTLVFVPQAALTSLDTVWGTATVTRNHAFMVFDTLYGLDDSLTPRPQMAEGHLVDDGGLRWTVRLRPGLLFHDGSPVLARDCVASLKRWMARDSMGQTLAGRVDSLDATDDRTLVFRLRRRFPALLAALAKLLPSPPVIMPERLALTDPFKQVSELIGSGPFRFVPGEYVSGVRSVCERFASYRPRDEAPALTSGGKRVLVDRVEWRVIPDAATAAAALRTGEVDWWEQPLPDLVPLLRQDPGVTVTHLDPYGLFPVLRFNHLQGPTTNRALRQAILAAIDPREVMLGVMGDEPGGFNAPVGCFPAGTAFASDAGMDRIGRADRDMTRIKALLAEAGYAGEKIVLMHPTDQPSYDAMSQVVSAALKRIGLAVDDQAMDWGTVVQRRASKAPLDKGGWSLFATSFSALDYADPLTIPAMRGNGDAAWYGWPTLPEMERLRDSWIETPDAGEQTRLARAMQLLALTEALYVPLGQYFPFAGFRRTLTGHLKGPLPLFWNVVKN